MDMWVAMYIILYSRSLRWLDLGYGHFLVLGYGRLLIGCDDYLQLTFLSPPSSTDGHGFLLLGKKGNIGKLNNNNAKTFIALCGNDTRRRIKVCIIIWF